MNNGKLRKMWQWHQMAPNGNGWQWLFGSGSGSGDSGSGLVVVTPDGRKKMTVIGAVLRELWLFDGKLRKMWQW
jgi:hypothetical protein